MNATPVPNASRSGTTPRLFSALAPPGSGVSVLLLTALFVVALAGRFSLDRVGLPTYGLADLRVPGSILLGLGALFWYRKLSARGLRPSWPPMVLVFTALIAVQLTSALWSPPGARLGKAAWDLAALLILVLAATVLSAGDPARAARVLLVLMVAAAIVYAVGALLSGPQDQGRYSAFGGGPNVFVRVMCMGMIAAITLGAARRLWLLPLPLLVAGAMLSGSRGGLLSLVAAAVAYVVLFRRRVRVTYLIAVVAIVALAAWAVWMLPTDAPATGGATMVANRYSMSGVQESGFSYRPLLLSYAWHLFVDHPLAGAGLDSYHAVFNQVYPHNYLVGLAAESGIVAVGLALTAGLCFWRDGRPWAGASREQVGCAMAAVYIAVASNFSGDYYDSRFFWLLAVVALLRTPRGTGGANLTVGTRTARTRA